MSIFTLTLILIFPHSVIIYSGCRRESWYRVSVLINHTSAYPCCPVSRAVPTPVGTMRLTGGGQADTPPSNRPTVAQLDDQPTAFVVTQPIWRCYGIGEMPALNRQGAVSNAVCSSHGDDIDSDRACAIGPRPSSEGERQTSPGVKRERTLADSSEDLFSEMSPVPFECGLEPERSALASRSSGGWMPWPVEEVTTTCQQLAFQLKLIIKLKYLPSHVIVS